jgi:hypothetical protein
MAEKVLVADASKYGATKEIAEKIGAVLKDAGFAVDVLPADRVRPREIVLFQGAVFAEKLRAISRWMMKKVKAPLGDFHDWNDITSGRGPSPPNSKKQMVKLIN